MLIQGFHLTQTDPSGFSVLQDAYLSFPQGSYTVLLSENVMAASAFLKMLAGENRPSAGTLRIDHQDIYAFSSTQKRRWLLEVGVIFSDFKLLSDRTLEENISFTLRTKGFWDESSLGAVGQLLAKAGLSDKAKLRPEQLTDGEKQMAMALRAMIFRPRLLLADDPFHGLEGEMFQTLFRFFRELHKTGTALVLSTSQPSFLEEAKKAENDPAIRWVQLENGVIYPLEEKVS